MSLSDAQALEIVKSPPNKSEVKKGEDYQSKLRILTLPFDLDDLQGETAWDGLLNNLRSKLTAEKFTAIVRYFEFPLSIVMMSNDIATDLYKVYDGRNAVFSVDYPNDRIKETGNALLSQLAVRNWMERVGKKVLKCQPNTVVIIDKDEKGDPILLAVPNEKIQGYKFTKTGAFDYIVFVHSKGKDERGNTWTKFGLYDDGFYRVYLEVGGNFTLIIKNPHDLGSCPARFYYDNPLVNKHKFDRSIPFSNVRGIMRQWTIIDLYDYYQDNVSSYQATEGAATGCDNDDCNDGRLYIDPIQDDNNVVVKDGYHIECPSCARKNLVGPGSHIEIDVDTDASVQDTRGIFRYIAPDIDALEYTGKKQQARENRIKENTVGFSGAVTSEAINETQVKALVESRKKPLLDIKSHLDDLYKWIVTSTIKLVYGVDVIVNANFGTEFFILSPEEIQDLIIKSKQAGAQATYIEQLNKLLISTEYKGDPNLVQRMLITADVQPAPFKTQEEARKLFKEGMMTREDYYIHSNFTDLLGQFERDNANIVIYGSEKTYEKKIESIYNTLLFYTNKKLPKDEQDDSSESTGTSDQGIEQN